MAVITKDLFAQMKEELFGVESEYVELKNGYGVNVIQLTAEGAVALASSQNNDTQNAIFAWTAACCVDDDLNPIFTKEDVAKLPHDIAGKLTSAVARLNGLLNVETSGEAEKNLEEVES